MDISPHSAGQAATRSTWTAASPSRIQWKWLLLAVTLFLVQVLPYLSYRWVTDESWYAGPGYTFSQWQGSSDPGMGPNEPEHTFDSRPPGTALIMAGSFKLLGVGQVQARMGSVLAGLAIVLLTYLLMRDLFGETAAVLAMLIAATDNLVVITSRTARPEALTTMAILLGLYALKRYAHTGSRLAVIGLGFAASLGTMFHVTLLGYIVSFGLLTIAIDWKQKRFPLAGATVYTLSYFAGLIPYIVWIFTAPNNAGIISFKEEFFAKAAVRTPMQKIAAEAYRYMDFFGFDTIHAHGLSSIPVRLPIPLILLTASLLLWRYRRSWFYVELALLLPSVLWLIYMANKSSRYLAILGPLFAMVIGSAVAAVYANARLRRTMVALASVVIIAQASANLYLLFGARKADYTQLSTDLHRLIPPGETVYGTITFWFGMRDHPFVAYERTDPEMAAEQFHARYFILNDRMMADGSVFDAAYYKDLTRRLVELTSKGDLVGELPDPYYGDLKIYRLRP